VQEAVNRILEVARKSGSSAQALARQLDTLRGESQSLAQAAGLGGA
jgi:hypothetical protein